MCKILNQKKQQLRELAKNEDLELELDITAQEYQQKTKNKINNIISKSYEIKDEDYVNGSLNLSLSDL